MTGAILIVDENPGIQRTLKRFLSQGGYPVVTTDSVRSAVNLVNQSPPSLIILDIKMPRFEGVEFIRLMRESECPLPIIVMTAYPTFFTREDALKNGVSAYVTKPFEPTEILRYISQLLAEGTMETRLCESGRDIS